jgi:hypothetical protein
MYRLILECEIIIFTDTGMRHQKSPETTTLDQMIVRASMNMLRLAQYVARVTSAGVLTLLGF